MNAVFTIVAKNYLPQARVLGDSIKRIHPDLPFHILLSDEAAGVIDLSKEKYPAIEVKDIGISSYRDMAFKYMLVEFATAVKPFFFDYLFKKFNYDKIIYFDPDICIYNSLESIFNSLDHNFIVLTPHITKLQIEEDGSSAESSFLFVGACNLGFVAFNNSTNAQDVIEWWKVRLRNQGYADFFDALHVDQKWMDLIPCFFDEGVLIERNAGYNVSAWNLHERNLSVRDGKYWIDGQPLVFFHFAGFNESDPDSITGPHKQTKFNLHSKPEYREIFRSYGEQLKVNQTELTDYTYSCFANGVDIFRFQRRLYRRLTQSGFVYENPFSTEKGSFYDLLNKNDYHLPKNNMFITDILQEDRNCQNQSTQNREIHVVSTGYVGGLSNTENMIQQSIIALCNAGIHVHMYYYPYKSRTDPELQGYCKLEKCYEYFHLEQPIYTEGYWAQLSRYDFGLAIFEPLIFGEVSMIHSRDYLEGCGSSRLLDYIRAKLGVIISPGLKFQYFIARRYAPVVVAATRDFLLNPRPILEEALRQKEMAVKKNVSAITTQGVAPRLGKFYTQVAKMGLNFSTSK